jgi:hypothetical protein
MHNMARAHFFGTLDLWLYYHPFLSTDVGLDSCRFKLLEIHALNIEIGKL